MGYYKSPEDMYSSRAKHFKRNGDRHWAMALNGYGNHHYAKARFCYEQAEVNSAKADVAHTSNAVFATHNCKRL